MRHRLERRLHKQLRRSQHNRSEFVAEVERRKQPGRTWETILRELILDTSQGSLLRGTAARVLASANRHTPVALLLQQFSTEEALVGLYETALAIEDLSDRATVRPMIRALEQDPHPQRRQAAARALRWMAEAGPRPAEALIRALVDQTQPLDVRVEAAESLSYHPDLRVIPPLLSMLQDPNVVIRFWAIYALGTPRPSYDNYRPDPRVITALHSMLQDQEIPPGNWWSVAREAQGMLGYLDPQYKAELTVQIQRVTADPNASPDDKRWAAFYRIDEPAAADYS